MQSPCGIQRIIPWLLIYLFTEAPWGTAINPPKTPSWLIHFDFSKRSRLASSDWPRHFKIRQWSATTRQSNTNVNGAISRKGRQCQLETNWKIEKLVFFVWVEGRTTGRPSLGELRRLQVGRSEEQHSYFVCTNQTKTNQKPTKPSPTIQTKTCIVFIKLSILNFDIWNFHQKHFLTFGARTRSHSTS